MVRNINTYHTCIICEMYVCLMNMAEGQEWSRKELNFRNEKLPNFLIEWNINFVKISSIESVGSLTCIDVDFIFGAWLRFSFVLFSKSSCTSTQQKWKLCKNSWINQYTHLLFLDLGICNDAMCVRCTLATVHFLIIRKFWQINYFKSKELTLFPLGFVTWYNITVLKSISAALWELG